MRGFRHRIVDDEFIHAIAVLQFTERIVHRVGRAMLPSACVEACEGDGVFAARQSSLRGRVVGVIASTLRRVRDDDAMASHRPGGRLELRRCGRFTPQQMAAERTRQREVVAQRTSFVIGAENAALLQQRNHAVGELLKPARQNIRHQIEAVGGAAFEPVLDVVGDLFRRADDDTMSAAARQRANQLTRRVAMRARLRERGVEERVITIAAAGQCEIVGQAFVEFQALDSDAQYAGQSREAIRPRNQIDQFIATAQSLGFGCADDRRKPRQHANRIAAAAHAAARDFSSCA